MRHHIALISTLFIRALASSALLGGLLQQKRLAALRTLFLDRLVPVDGVAFRIVCAAVEDFPAA